MTTLNLLLGIDESAGTQDATIGSATSNDVETALPVALSTALGFETLAGSAIATALSGATSATSTGTQVVTFSGTQDDVAFSDAAGAALAGQDSGLSTTSGRKIYLYTSAHDNNVLLGREANLDGTANAGGSVAFALYLDTGAGGDAGATGAKVWAIQYEAVQHGDIADANDFVSLAQDLYVTASKSLDFSMSGAPSGQSLFLMFGDGTPAAGEAEIIVTGKHPANQSEGVGITTGDTVNTGQGGGETTIGSNNQMINPGEGMYFTFVKGADTGLTVPNLDQNEADVEANIQFDSFLAGVRAASFDVAQLQQAKQATLTITAINNTDAAEKGVAFIDGLGDSDDLAVNIDSVTVVRSVRVGRAHSEYTYTFTDGSPAQGGISVDFTGDTAKVSGVAAGDRITYHTDADHNRVLIDNAGNANARVNGSFDIGGFSIQASEVATHDAGNVAFIDDAPALAFGNLAGTGVTTPQLGGWSSAAGADGLGSGGVDVSLTGFDLVKPDHTVVAGTTFSLAEDSVSPDASGNYHFTGSVTGDFDNDSGTADTTQHFSLAIDSNGTYAFDLVEGFESTSTVSTAAGSLDAGGPDAVRTLTVGSEKIVFFSVNPLAAASDIIQYGAETGAPDYTEADLEAAHPAVIDFSRALNVSTAGIGDKNNNLQGDTLAAISAADESFVANAATQFTSAKVFIDNAVTGYNYTAGERLYYQILYSDGSDSGQVLVSSNVSTGRLTPSSFTIDGGGKPIDAIQLTMAKGTVKIPAIEFVTRTNDVADSIVMSFTANIADRDGDTASTSFKVDLSSNALAGPFDHVLNGTASSLDWFNIDLRETETRYQVNGFDVGASPDKLVLLGDALANFDIDNSGADAVVTVHESGGQTTVVTVVGVDLDASQVMLA